MKLKVVICIISFVCIFGGAFAEKPDKLFKMARKTAAKNPREALRLYSDALKYSDVKWKKRSDCLVNRGILFFDLEMLEPAMNDFNMAVAQDENNFNARKYRAKILFMLRNYPRALEELGAAENISNKDAEIFYLRGRIFFFMFKLGTEHLKSNMLQSSVEEFTKAVNLNKKYYQALYHRALIYVLIADFPSAEADLLRVIKIKKDYCPALCEMANVFLKKKEDISALDYLEKCLAVSEKYKPALDMILLLCHQRQMTDKLKDYLQIALKHYPMDKQFRNLNSAYKTVPEESLPKLPEPADDKPVKQPDKTASLSDPEPPQSVWLEASEADEVKTNNSDNNVKVEFYRNETYRENNADENNKDPLFNDNNWY